MSTNAERATASRHATEQPRAFPPSRTPAMDIDAFADCLVGSSCPRTTTATAGRVKRASA
jgi:hypothetical protein